MVVGRWSLFALAAVVALVGPLVLSGFWVRVLTSIYMYAAMAQAANLITGYTGYAALGNVVFFGVGAYTTTVLMLRLAWPFWLAFPAAGVACVLFTLLVGVPLLRTRGHYFVMATIGLNLAMLELTNNLEFAGGGSGLVLPVPDYPPEVFFGAIYYLMLALLVACTATVWWITGHRFGYGLRAIKEDEQAAAVMGVDTTRYKVAAWAISGAFTGLAGAGYAVWLSFIQPSTVFDILVSVKIFNILVLGGPGTLLGPIVGALALELMDNLVWTKFLELHLLILGILVIAVVILFPRGLVDLLSGRVSLRGLIHEMKQRRL